MANPVGIARPTLITILGWLLMGAGALVTPVSLVALLMLVVGGDGTQGATLLGGLMVIAVPPATACAGFGLWRRWRWAYVYVLLLLGGIAVWNVGRVLRGPTETRTVVSATGAATHILGSDVDVPLRTALAVVSLGVLALLLARSVRAEFFTSARPRTAKAPPGEPPLARRADGRGSSSDARGWRVAHQGRDEMSYEELRDGRWERIRIGGEMLMGRAHHVIYFASPREWLTYPGWARDRRDEIIARVKSELTPPDYEYHGDAPGAAPLPAATAPAAARTRVPAHAAPASRAQRRALAVAIALLLGGTVGMVALVAGGLARGAIWFPTPHVTQHRAVVRADEPVTFWISIGLYAAIGAGTGGLAAWGIRDGLRLRG